MDIDSSLNQLQKIAHSRPKLSTFTPSLAEEEVKNLIHILDIAKEDQDLLFQELNRYGVCCNTRDEVIERIEFLSNLLPLYIIARIKHYYPLLSREVNFNV